MIHVSEKELDARIMALIRQRNDALDREAALAGRVFYLEGLVKELENKIESRQHENQ